MDTMTADLDNDDIEGAIDITDALKDRNLDVRDASDKGVIVKFLTKNLHWGIKSVRISRSVVLDCNTTDSFVGCNQ